MKKWFAGMMAGVLAAVMCVSFAACGEKGIDAESIKGKEVTEAQWDAAFEELMSEESVYTVRGEVIHKITATRNDKTASYTLKFFGFSVENGKQAHFKIEQQIVDHSGDVKEVFRLSDDDIEENTTGDHILERYSKPNGTGYDYYESGWDTDAWTYYPNDRYGTGVRNFVEVLVSLCKGNFASFRYDGEKKGYVAAEKIASDEDVDGYLPYTILKLNEDGKFVALCGEKELDYEDYDEEDIYANIKFQFTIEYTAEEIVFPTDYVEK